MKLRNVLFAAVAGTCLAAAQQSVAGPIWGFSSDTSSGRVVSFDWDGGNAGGWGTAGTLEAAMNYAAFNNGNFSSAGFRARKVNIFLVDFTGDTSGTFNDAGLTMFVMWGNGRKTLSQFTAEAQLSPRINEGNDGSFNSSVAEIFALGSGVTIDDNGPVTVDIDVNNTETPIGYAVTNINRIDGQRINQQWTLTGAIRKMLLHGDGQGVVWRGVDDDGDGDIFTDGLVLIIPAPPAALLGLAGLGGIALVSRRRKSDA